jgi:V8-like Glu-specific endopeptidase
MEPIFDDYDKLKIVRNCEIQNISDGVLYHNCDVSGGNSGSALFVPDTRKLVGIVSGGADKFTGADTESFGVDSKQFYQVSEDLSK